MMISTTSSSINVKPLSPSSLRRAGFRHGRRIAHLIGPAAARLDCVRRYESGIAPGKQRGVGRRPTPLSHRSAFVPGSYQVPPLVAEQPALSFEPVAQLRVVVPVDEREMTNVTFVGSRVEPTVIV